MPVRPRGAVRSVTHILLLLASLAGVGCTADSSADRASSNAASAVSVIDDAGRTVTLAAPARRVISLIPAQTEIVTILAGADVVIARTAWDRQPSLQHLPSIGNALTPSVEWLAAQRPDLIVAWPDAQSRDVVQRLGDVGIPVYASRVESVAEIRSMIERLGVLLGADTRADSLLSALDAQLDSVRAQVVGRAQRSVLYMSTDPLSAAGPGTYIDELITIAGGRNVFGDLRQLWPQVSLEEIVRRQPDVIIRPSAAALTSPMTGLLDQPGWRAVRAVQRGHVYAVDPDFYNRPGAGVGAAARMLAELIHADELHPDSVHLDVRR